LAGSESPNESMDLNLLVAFWIELVILAEDCAISVTVLGSAKR
jgi:hypothetical protein